MQISSLDLMMQHQTEEILDISRRVSHATETIFGGSMGNSNNQHEELTNTIIRVSEQTSEVYRKIEAGQSELTTIRISPTKPSLFLSTCSRIWTS